MLMQFLTHIPTAEIQVRGQAGVAWAVENGIIGNSDYLNPTGNAGRAEVAQIIYNMSNNGIL